MILPYYVEFARTEEGAYLRGDLWHALYGIALYAASKDKKDLLEVLVELLSPSTNVVDRNGNRKALVDAAEIKKANFDFKEYVATCVLHQLLEDSDRYAHMNLKEWAAQIKMIYEDAVDICDKPSIAEMCERADALVNKTDFFTLEKKQNSALPIPGFGLPAHKNGRPAQPSPFDQERRRLVGRAATTRRFAIVKDRGRDDM
jgi:hypothetical protein